MKYLVIESSGLDVTLNDSFIDEAIENKSGRLKVFQDGGWIYDDPEGSSYHGHIMQRRFAIRGWGAYGEYTISTTTEQKVALGQFTAMLAADNWAKQFGHTNENPPQELIKHLEPYEGGLRVRYQPLYIVEVWTNIIPEALLPE